LPSVLTGPRIFLGKLIPIKEQREIINREADRHVHSMAIGHELVIEVQDWKDD